MNAWEEVMNQPYYSSETLRQLTDGMADFMQTYRLDDTEGVPLFCGSGSCV